MRRAILLIVGLLTSATFSGCGDSGASDAPPPDAVVGKPGPQPSAMPPGAADAMKKSLTIKPKRGGSARPGEVPH